MKYRNDRVSIALGLLGILLSLLLIVRGLGVL